MEIEHFVQRLAMHLTTWEVTSFLLGEYSEQQQSNPVFTVADGVIWLSQVTDRNSVVRKTTFATQFAAEGLESTLGEGARFTLTLPRAQEDLNGAEHAR